MTIRRCSARPALLAGLILARFCHAEEPKPPHESLIEYGLRYGFPPPRTGEKTLTFSSQYTEMQFEQDSRKLRFNGILIWLNAPVTHSNGTWTLSRADANRILSPLLRSGPVLRDTECTTVVLDPGHGGDDFGAMAPRLCR